MKKALKVIINIIIWLFVALAALMTVVSLIAQQNNDGLANLFGKSPVTVLTDSMSGTIEKGDMIIVDILSPEGKAALAVGDVITYRADLNGDGEISFGELNTHRIVEIKEESGHRSFLTQGDNKETNPVKDNYETGHENVVAKYTGTRIPGVGGAINYMRTPTGFLICIVIPLLLFFLYEIYNFIAAIVANRAAKSAVENEEEIKRRAVEEYLAQQNAAPAAEAPAAEAPAAEAPAAEAPAAEAPAAEAPAAEAPAAEAPAAAEPESKKE